MADSVAGPKETPTKKKRKSELDLLQEESSSDATTNNKEPEENPWTLRENLELLKIHRDYNRVGNVQQRVDRLNDMMSRIRTTWYQPQKPKRTEYEFNSQLRSLKNDGVEIEDLQAQLNPLQQPPPKKKKKKPTR